MLVFTLKRIDPITRAHPSLSSIRCDPLSADEVSRTASISRQVFYPFRLAIVLEGISSNWTRQEATHQRRLRLVSTESSNSRVTNPRETFPLSEQLSGRLVEGEKVEACFRDALSSNPASSTFISPLSGGVSAGAA